MTIFEPGLTHPVESLQDFEERLISALPAWEPRSEPVKLVVSSKSLQRHWVRRLAKAKGAVLGVDICTYTTWINEILQGTEREWAHRSAWVEYQTRRMAMDEPVLRRALGDLDQGLDLVVRMVHEFLDAGFLSAHSDAILEAIREWPQSATLGVGSGVAPRVAALVRVARRLAAELESRAPHVLPTAIDAAISRLEAVGSDACPHRGIVFLGFSDATGKVADLLEAAQRFLGASVAIEMPPNPAHPMERDPGVLFAAPYHDRFSGRWGPAVGQGRAPDVLRWFAADDPFAEAQAVAAEVRRAVGEGVSPENIGLIVRSFAGWASPLRRALSGAGVPYSGVDAEGIGGGASRRMQGIMRCLEDGLEADAGIWATACDFGLDSRERLAFDALGVRTVADIATRLKPGESVSLEAREGIGRVDGEVRTPRARLYSDEATAIHQGAIQFVECFSGWPEKADVAVHLSSLQVALSDGLSVPGDDPLWDAVHALAVQFDPVDEIERSEWIRLVVHALQPLASRAIGGVGGGVSILDATEARGRTFERLFVLGLNRGQFPRLVREDPLMPDSARQALQQFLPDLRLKRIGIHEERFLFAQLVASSPHVTLSCSRNDVRGVQIHESSFLVELKLHKTLEEEARISVTERPAWEVSKAKGLRGLGIESAFESQPGHQDLCRLALARHGREAVHGPYLGQVGPALGPVDPRQREMYVTTVESVAQCPWRAFVEKHLGVRERPDPHRSLPEVSGHLLGRVVHKVVERMVNATIQDSVLAVGEARPLIWPSESTLTAWIIEAAEACLASDGVAWRGFSKAVVVPAMAALSELQTLDGDLEGVWGAERKFEVAIADGLTIAFKADRLDVIDGQPVLTDIKLGKPPTVHKTAETRRTKVIEGVRQGRLLQGILYARAQPASAGRYLYIKPSMDVPERSFIFKGDDSEMNQALELIVREVDQAVQNGHFFPRVSEATVDKIPNACGHCSVRETCIVEDSALRRTLMESMAEAGPGSDTVSLWFRGQGGAE